MELKPGYARTEVGAIPEDWEVKLLGELGTFKNGINKGKESFGHGFPFVNLMDVFGIPKISAEAEFGLVDSSSAERKLYELRRGDVLFIRSSVKPEGVGLTTLISEDLPDTVFSGFLIRFRETDWLALEFKEYCFSQTSVRKQIITSSTVSANTNVNQNALKALQIAFPPQKKEQRAIGTALSDADALIGVLERLIAKKRDVKQAAMQQLLTGQIRLPGFSGAWQLKRLGLLASIQRGASPRPIDSPIWFDESSAVGWIRISDATASGMYLQETTQHLSPLGVQHSRPVRRGSLIMSICATVGRPIITQIDACIHDGFVTFDNLGIDKYFLYYILKSIEGEWSRHGQTGSQMNLNTGLINRTEIRVPPTTEEQTTIADILFDIDAEIVVLEQRLAKTRALKQGMMQELLTGNSRLI